MISERPAERIVSYSMVEVQRDLNKELKGKLSIFNFDDGGEMEIPSEIV